MDRPWNATALALLLLSLLMVMAARPVRAEGGSTFVVNSAADHDDGVCAPAPDDCTLREAILAANSDPMTDTIAFAIGGGGAATIAVTAALPTIFAPVLVDGTTQPGYDGAPLIELDGSAGGVDASGLRIHADGVTVRALVINRFTASGIHAAGSGLTLQGSYLGTDASGTTAQGNGTAGLYMEADSITDSLIGGAAAGEGNVIAGNEGGGVVILAFQYGSEPPSRPLRILGNAIGVGSDGTTLLGNGSASDAAGIRLISTIGVEVGGGAPGEGNTIAGHSGYGIVFECLVPAAMEGPGEGDDGCWWLDPSTMEYRCCTGYRNPILQNALYANTQGGTRLDTLPNDPGDGDQGFNASQNYPELTLLAPSGPGPYTVEGHLNSLPNRTFYIELFEGDMSPGSCGQARRPLSSLFVTTDANGLASFQSSSPTPRVTAMATDPLGNTSGISPCAVTGPTAVQVATLGADRAGSAPFLGVLVALAGALALIGWRRHPLRQPRQGG